MPEDKIVNLGGTIDGPRTPIVPDVPSGMGNVAGADVSFDDLFTQGLASSKFKGKENIPVSSFYTGNRYPESRPFTDVEEMAAQQQSTFDKWRNSVGKMAGVAATSFVSGTAGLVYGIGAAWKDQKFSSLYNNDVTRAMDDSMKYLEDYAPNYYTKNETDAEWYSPDNLLTANFWGDKVFKNLGYAVGALGGGVAWGSALKAIGLTNKLVQAGAGMEAATAAEAAMTSVPKLQKFGALESSLNSLGQKYLRTPVAGMLKDSDRILTSVMGTFGESSLEGLQNLNSFREKLIQDYKNLNGYAPQGADLDQINMYAEKVGNYTWGMNTLLLSATNYIQLPKILGSSRRADKALINDIQQKELGGVWSKYAPTTRLGRIAQSTKGIAGLLFAPTEAFEEGAQFAIQTGTDSYFNRAYKNRADVKDFLSTLNGTMGEIVTDGVDKALSTKEGIENILIGGLSGGMQQAGYVGTYTNKEGKTRVGFGKSGNIAERGLFGRGGERKTNTDLALEALGKTNIATVLNDQAKFLAIGIGSQKLRQQAIEENDVLNEKDFERDYVLSYVMPRAKYGKIDSVYQEIESYQKQAMSEEGFQELVNSGIANQQEDRNQFLDRTNSLKETAKSVDNFYDAINDKYQYERDKDGRVKYSDSVIDRLVYSASKINDYDKRIPSLSNALAESGIDTFSILDGLIEKNTPNKEATKEALDKINKIDTTSDIKDDLKSGLSDLIELSLRRKRFIDEYDAVKKNPEIFNILEDFNFDQEEEAGTVKVKQTFTPEGATKAKTVTKELEVGKEYSLSQPIRRQGNSLQIAPKVTVLSKTLGGEYEVQLPDGTTSFLTPSDFKQFDISEADNSYEQLNDILDKAIDTVLRRKKYSELEKPTENKLEYINSLNDPELINDIEALFNGKAEEFLKEQSSIQAKRERIVENAEQIQKAQDQVEDGSSDIATGEAPVDADLSNSWEDMKKVWNRLFTSTIGDSVDWAKKQGRAIAPHVTYFNEFINNVKNFKNREQIKAIIVSPKQAEALGLKGLAEMSFKSGGLNPEGVTDPMNGFVGAVFIRIDKNNKKFFIDKNGEKIAPIDGKQVDVTKVVFSTMPQVDLYYSNKSPRFRQEQEEDAKIAAAWWEGKRAELFEADANKYDTFDFGISKGIPTVDKDNPEKNFIGDIIIDEDKIATQAGLIEVSTKGTLAHNDGNNYKFAVGRPALRFDDVLTFLFNSKISKNKAQSIYKVLEQWSDETNRQILKGEDIVVDEDYAKFLRNILYWKTDGAVSKNKIFLDPKTGLFHIGEKTYDFSNLSAFQSQIVSDLQETYHNVNNKTLDLGLAVKFTELYLDKNNELQKRVWPNYQSYLLASKNPDGSARLIDDSPLYTNISKPSESVPYAFKQKYAYFMGMDNGIQTVKKESSAAITEGIADAAVETRPTSVPNTIIVNDKEIALDNKTVNSLPVGTFGDFDFIASPDGQVTPVDNKNNNKMILDILDQEGSKMLNVIKDTLKGLGRYEEGKTDQEYVERGIPTIIKGKILTAKQQLAAPVAQAPQQEAPVVSDKPVINIYWGSPESSTNTKLLSNLAPRKFTYQDKEYGSVEHAYQTLKSGSFDQVTYDKYVKAGGYGTKIRGKAVQQGFDNLQLMRDLVVESFKQNPSQALLLLNYSDFTHTTNEVIDKAFLDGVRIAQKNAELAALETKPTAPVVEETKGDVVNLVALEYGKDVINNKPLSAIASQDEYNDALGIETTKDYEEYDIAEQAFESQEDYDLYLKDFENRKKQYDTAKASLKKEGKPAQTTEVKKINIAEDDPEYRLVGVNKSTESITATEIELFKAYVAKVAPGIPYEFLDNLLYSANGEAAWGAFEDGVAKIFKGGLKGTEYHELFEGIYKGFLSETEKAALIDEFKSNKGSFLDRESGKMIQYVDATDKQAKERIADDFGDYRLGKIKAKSLGQKILEFFKGLMDFFKSFVNKPSLKNQLFKAIDTGKFKKSVFPTSKINEAAEYRAVDGLNEQQTNDFIQDITSRLFNNVFSTNKSLFNIENVTSKQIFDEIKEKYIAIGVIGNAPNQITEKTYSELVNRTKDFLKRFRIEFDEDSKITINDEGSNNRDYAADAFTVDFKKSSPYAVKLLIGTLVKTNKLNQESASVLELPKADISTSSVGGATLIPFSKVFGTLINRLANVRDIDTFVAKLYQLAKENSDYVRLFKRLGGNLDNGTMNFSQFEDHDWRLFISFYQVFSKQKPKFFMQYKEGDVVYSGDANQASIVKQIGLQWIENIKRKANDSNSIVTLNDKVYSVNKESKDYPKETPTDPKDAIKFLNDLGVTFSLDTFNRLRGDQLKDFADAISGIKTSIDKNGELLSLKKKSLDITGHFDTLANLFVKINTPNEDSTFFNAENKRQQSITDSNAISYLESVFNSADTLDELLEKMPQLKDVFSKNSQVLKKGGLFFNADGDRIADFKVEVISGVKDVTKNKGQSIAKLSEGERFTLEINRNLNGDYYVLVPADGATEWMMNLGNAIGFTEFMDGTSEESISKAFVGYLKDDIALAKDAKTRAKLNNVGDKAKDLRFMKDILSGELLKKATAIINNKKATDADIQKFIDDNIIEINKSVQEFIDGTVNETMQTLIDSKQILDNKNGTYSYLSLDNAFVTKFMLNKKNLTEKQLTDIIKFANTNYVINNIEYHKILFGDPYQFKITDKNGKVILDETKRIKSYLSPRRVTFDSPELNTFLNQKYNTVAGVKLTDKDYGYHEYKSFLKTFTAKDVIIRGSLASLFPSYAKTNEADAASWMMAEAYKETKIKNGQWTDEAEDFHQWQMAYTRQNIPGYKYTSKELEAHDKELVSKPMPPHVIEVLKPIVSGNKFGKTQIDSVLDKFSQLPLYYSAIKGTNLENLYMKMFKEGYDYFVVESGRKEGAEGLHNLYKPNGQFNDEAFNNTVNVPWTAYGIQVETSFEGEKLQTRGSQLTKLATLDLYAFGEPIGKNPERKEVIKNAVQKNTDILRKMHANGYRQLLNKLGIEDLGDGFNITNKTAIAKALRQEMLRREISSNGIDSISLDPTTGEFMIPFEASTNYKQIKDILYSIVDKAISSPKMGGMSGVQVSATMWESSKGRSIAIKRDGEYVKVTAEEYENASDEEKKSVVFTDDSLKFYTEDDPFCEIMLPNWFRSKLAKGRFKDYTDEQLIEYLNKSGEEGKSILRGIGFRIPTQALSSVENFRVKGFLPSYMGASVVVPSEITTKAGSDFDIDKLNMYLKNIYIDATGDIRLVKGLETEEATKEFYGKVFDSISEKIAINKSEILEALQIAAYQLKDPNNLTGKYSDILSKLLENADPIGIEEQLMKEIGEISDKNLQAELKRKYVETMYTQSIENEYYESLEELLSLPENFERLVKPNDDTTLKDLASELDDLRGEDESGIKNRLLNRNYMTKLRHAFITAKKWVGIAAVNITGQSLSQKSEVYVKNSRQTIALPHNTIVINGEKHISLSGVFDSAGKYISDKLSMYANAFVDVSKDPYILKVIYSDRIVGTFMFLERAGVSMENTAMFLNQPVVKEYINYLDSSGLGRNAMYNDKNIKYIRSLFPTSGSLLSKAEINIGGFKTNITDYAKNGELTAKQNAEQFIILDEFLKYSKLADANYAITQAINYDTTSFRSADELNRKQIRTEREQAINLISSPKDILQNSSLGDLATYLDKATEALGEVLKFNQPAFRAIIKNVISEYAKNNYLSVDKFSRISEKLSASFLDYIIQIKLGGAIDVAGLTTGVGAVANRIETAKILHPEIKMLQELETVSSDLPDGTKTVKLQVNLKDAYDEDLFTGYMREMRDNPITKDLYNDLVKLAISQGTYQSAVSIKNIVPIENYAALVAPVIGPLVVDDDLRSFYENSMFQRNNWKDEDITPRINPEFEDMFNKYDQQPIGFDSAEEEIFQYKTKSFPSIDTLGVTADDRRIFLVDPWKIGSGNSLITVSSIVNVKGGREMVDFLTGKTITNLFYAQRKRKGDTDSYKTYGYQLVKYKDGTPLINAEGKYVYKLVNLYGDGQLASEYHTSPVPSVLNNNTVEMDVEIPNGDIISYFAPQIKEEIVSLQEGDILTESLEDEVTRLKNEIDNMQFIQEQMSDTTTEMIIANNLPRILPESAQKESGANTGNKSDISTSLLSKSGVTVDQAANDIWESEFGIDSNVDTQDVRNIIIDILTSGSVSNYKKSFNESLGIKGLKQDLIEKEEELKLEREKAKVTTAELKASQLSLFDTNAPAGKPAIKRTKKSCD